MFRLLGFDVKVRTGFVMFLGLIILLYPDQFGVWLALGLAGFTLVHELGHAVAARSAGAHASISLDFMAGYTSFRAGAGRPISLPRRAVISAAGPATHIVTSLAVLYAMGADPFSLDSVRQSDATAALWWAGPAIGAMNLIPVLPLDGGHIVLAGVQAIVGERALRVMAIASMVITGGGAVWMALSGRPTFSIFIAFLILGQFQILQSTGSKTGRSAVPERAAGAEALAWQTGRPGVLEPGQRLSPWYEAHRALLAGRADPTAPIVRDLASPTPGRWAPPTGATAEQLRAVVDALPADLPVGNPQGARVAVDIMLAVGAYQRGGDYAAKVFNQHRSSPLAVGVARAAAATGDRTNAVAWLRAAEDAARDEGGGYLTLLGRSIAQAPELVGLRDDADVRAILTRVT